MLSRDDFMIRLRALAEEAGSSEDYVVSQSGVVLYGLTGSILAGEMFFTPFVDQVAEIVQRNLDTLKTMV